MAHYWVPKAIDITIASALYDRNIQSTIITWSIPSITTGGAFVIERICSLNNFDSWKGVGTIEFNSSGNYLFTNKVTEEGKYLYRIRTIDQDGEELISEPIEVYVASAPEGFALEQNYPNPFPGGSVGNTTTRIQFSTPEVSFVVLKLYDLFGREVKTLVNQELQSGSHIVMYNAINEPSGIYFYKLNAGSLTKIRSLNIVK